MKNIIRVPHYALKATKVPRAWNVINNPRSANAATVRKGINTVHRSLKPFGFEANRIGVLLENIMVSTGQRPSVTTSRKGVAAYGIRAGALCGVRVTKRSLKFTVGLPKVLLRK